MSIELNPAQEPTRADLEELLQEIEEAERQFAAGLGVPHEVTREQILWPQAGRSVLRCAPPSELLGEQA